MITIHAIMLEVCKLLLREWRVLNRMHPTRGDMPEPVHGVYDGMED